MPPAPRILLVAIVLLSALVGRAGAQELTLSAPPECASKDELWQRLQLRARKLRLRLPADLRIDLQITKASGSYLAVLRATQTAEQSQTRKIEDPDCEALHDALLITILLLLPAAETEESSVDPSEVPTVSEGDKSLSALPLTEASRSFRFGIAALADRGSLPKTAAGLTSSFALLSSRYTVGIDTTLLAPTRQNLAGDDRLQGSFFLWTVGLRLCTRLASAFELCVSGEAGAIHASASGVRQPEDKIVPWMAATASLGYKMKIAQHWHVVASMQGVTPFRRHKFVVTGSKLIHQTDSLTLRPQLGLEWTFF